MEWYEPDLWHYYLLFLMLGIVVFGCGGAVIVATQSYTLPFSRRKQIVGPATVRAGWIMIITGCLCLALLVYLAVNRFFIQI